MSKTIAQKIKIDRDKQMPIYMQLANRMKELIESNELKASEKLPGAVDLGKEIGISPLTVRNAYNTLQQDDLIIKKHGYGTFVRNQPNVAPARLKSIDIGLLIANQRMNEHYAMSQILKVLEVSKKNDWNFHVSLLSNGSIHEAFNTFYYNLMQNNHLNGLLLAGWLYNQDIAKLTEMKIPYICIDADYRGEYPVHCIQIDDFAAVEYILKRLDCEGHKQVGMLAGPTAIPGESSMIRRSFRLAEAYRAILRSMGKDVDSNLINYCEYNKESAFSAVSELLKLPEPPTAIIVNGDVMAAGVVDALNKLDRKDVTVANYGDSEDSVCSYCYKPIGKVVDAAVEMLESMILGGKVEKIRTLQPEINK